MYAKRLILISAILLIILGIVATYLGAANLMRYTFWSSNYGGEHTEDGMWTEDKVGSYMVFGTFFTVTGILGVIGGLWLFFKGVTAVVGDDKHTLRKWLPIWAIIALIPSPGLVFVGILLLFVFMMYRSDRYDFFGLLLEDVGRERRRIPMGADPVGAGAGDARDTYATGYQEKGLYAEDYAQAAYGGGDDAYTGGGQQGGYDTPAEPAALVSETPSTPSAPPAAPEAGEVPMCSSCGKVTEWIEEYGRYYCYDCDSYV